MEANFRASINADPLSWKQVSKFGSDKLRWVESGLAAAWQAGSRSPVD